jgi:predicted TIM-barrel fold metal-dependent hydrolase
LAVENSPSVAPLENRFPSDYSRPERVLRDLAEAYPGKLMWGTDSPGFSWVAVSNGIHYELLSTYEEEFTCLSGLSEETKARICEQNTLDFLKLKHEAKDTLTGQ